jgi:hypothetical protein
VRRALGSFLSIPLLLVAFMPVAAQGPTREAAPLPDLIVDTSCGFTVNVTFPVNDEYALTFTDSGGQVTRLIITGRLVVTFTNALTGASYTANISGPSHIDFLRGTNTQVGRIGGPVGSLPGLNVFAGRVDFANGTMHGRLIADVCALLAPPT